MSERAEHMADAGEYYEAGDLDSATLSALLAIAAGLADVAYAVRGLPGWSEP